MSYVAWLIEEAWDHHRRRSRRLLIAALTAGAVAAVIWLMIPRETGPTGAPVQPPPRPDVVVSTRVLSQAPYLGVRCPIPNSVACDRVGLAVWLKRPAMSVTATIAGAPVPLDWFGDQRLERGVPRRAFDGYLQPAGIVSRLHIQPVSGDVVVTRHGKTQVIARHQMWFGQSTARPPLIRLTIHYPSGQTLITQLRVGLSAGWG